MGWIAFRGIWRSIRATIEHGYSNTLTLDISSMAYYYLREPRRGGPPLPPVEGRLPRPDEEAYLPER